MARQRLPNYDLTSHGNERWTKSTKNLKASTQRLIHRSCEEIRINFIGSITKNKFVVKEPNWAN